MQPISDWTDLHYLLSASDGKIVIRSDGDSYYACFIGEGRTAPTYEGQPRFTIIDAISSLAQNITDEEERLRRIFNEIEKEVDDPENLGNAIHDVVNTP